MKSIKEKSEEYAKMKHTDKNLIDIVSWDFEAGANYVLEQIEKLTNNQNWCAFTKQSHKELKELIEQLKK